MTPALEMTGKTLFDGELLLDHLEQQVRQQIVREYRALAPRDRKFSQLKLRRRLAMARTITPVSITSETAIEIIGGHPDGRIVAEHRSKLAGRPELLGYAPCRVLPPRRPVATIRDDQLILTVLFNQASWSFVSALVRAELDLIEAVLARQRDALSCYNDGFAELVRRLVREVWPVLAAR